MLRKIKHQKYKFKNNKQPTIINYQLLKFKKIYDGVYKNITTIVHFIKESRITSLYIYSRNMINRQYVNLCYPSLSKNIQIQLANIATLAGDKISKKLMNI